MHRELVLNEVEGPKSEAPQVSHPSAQLCHLDRSGETLCCPALSAIPRLGRVDDDALLVPAFMEETEAAAAHSLP